MIMCIRYLKNTHIIIITITIIIIHTTTKKLPSASNGCPIDNPIRRLSSIATTWKLTIYNGDPPSPV